MAIHLPHRTELSVFEHTNREIEEVIKYLIEEESDINLRNIENNVYTFEILNSSILFHIKHSMTNQIYFYSKLDSSEGFIQEWSLEDLLSAPYILSEIKQVILRNLDIFNRSFNQKVGFSIREKIGIGVANISSDMVKLLVSSDSQKE